jgi:hypothetical protein
MNPSIRNLLTAALATLALAACGADKPSLDQPFEGPGWDADKKATKDTTQRRLIAAATRLVVKAADPRSHTTFLKVMGPINDQLEKTPGLVGHSTRIFADLSEDWTFSVWESEADLAAFVTSDAHMDAIDEMQDFALPSYVVMWEIQNTDLPLDWDAVAEKLDRDGRDAFGARQYQRR